jgi:hypothetical protein
MRRNRFPKSQLNVSARNLIMGLQAMHQLPGDADEIAATFGITETLKQIREKRQQEPQSYVYFVDTVTAQDHYFKIGKSVRPHMRLKELQTGRAANMPPEWGGQAIRPLALRLGGLMVESSIHTALREHRLTRTEWFIGHTILPFVTEQGDWNNWNGEPPDEQYFASAQRFASDALPLSHSIDQPSAVTNE